MVFGFGSGSNIYLGLGLGPDSRQKTKNHVFFGSNVRLQVRSFLFLHKEKL